MQAVVGWTIILLDDELAHFVLLTSASWARVHRKAGTMRTFKLVQQMSVSNMISVLHG